MTQAVTVFRWDDPGAPQIVDGKPSEYMEVLKKCLVEGYGAKTPLGWILSVDEHLTAAPYMVLKNDTVKDGSGSAVVFDATDDTAGTNTKVQCCQSYVAKDNLINVGSSFVFNRYSTGNNLLKNWMVIGTETAFYIFVTSPGRLAQNYFGTNLSILFFVGDFQSNYLNDPARFITMAGSSIDSVSHDWNSMLNGKVGSYQSNNLTNVFSLDGGNTRENHSINSVFGNNPSINESSVAHEIVDISALAECYLFAGISSLHSGSGAYLNNSLTPWFRGKVPGLFFSAQAGFRDESMPHIKVIDGVNYFQIPSAHSEHSCAWINMEQW